MQKKNYEVGIYAETKREEQIICQYIQEGTVCEIENSYDIFFEKYRAVFITKRTYKKLNLDYYNSEIPSGECFLENYKLPASLIVVVDADIHDKLHDGFVSIFEYCSLSNQKSMKYLMEKIDISAGISCLCKEIMDSRKTIQEKYIALNILRSIWNLTDEELSNLKKKMKEMDEIIINEAGIFTMDEAYRIRGYIDIYGRETMLNNQLRDKLYDGIDKVFEVLKEIPEKYEYVVEKVDKIRNERLYTFFYNKKLQLVDYNIESFSQDYREDKYLE